MDQLHDLLQTADVLLLDGDTTGALETLARAHRASPNSPEPYYHRAELLVSMGGESNLKKAWMDLVRAITLGMNGVEVHFALMRTLVDMGQIEAAKAAYVEAIALDPQNVRLREWAIRLAILDDNLPQALRLAQKEESRAPGNFHWMRWEAELLLMTADYAGACKAFSALIEAHAPAEITPGGWEASQWGDILLKRAEACRMAGDFAGARADLDSAEAYIPGEPGIPFGRGLIAWAYGDTDTAFDLLTAGLTTAAPGVRTRFWEALADYPRQQELRKLINEGENHVRND